MYNYSIIGPDKKNILNCKQSTAWEKVQRLNI